MSTVAEYVEPLIQDLRVTEHEIIAGLKDGRRISVPITWS